MHEIFISQCAFSAVIFWSLGLQASSLFLLQMTDREGSLLELVNLN